MFIALAMVQCCIGLTECLVWDGKKKSTLYLRRCVVCLMFSRLAFALVFPCISYGYTIPYHTIPFHTTPHQTIPYHTIPHHIISYHTTPYHIIPYHTIPHHTIPHYTKPYQTIQHHTKPYHIIPNHTIYQAIHC